MSHSDSDIRYTCCQHICSCRVDGKGRDNGLVSYHIMHTLAALEIPKFNGSVFVCRYSQVLMRMACHLVHLCIQTVESGRSIRWLHESDEGAGLHVK